MRGWAVKAVDGVGSVVRRVLILLEGMRVRECES